MVAHLNLVIPLVELHAHNFGQLVRLDMRAKPARAAGDAYHATKVFTDTVRIDKQTQGKGLLPRFELQTIHSFTRVFSRFGVPALAGQAPGNFRACKQNPGIICSFCARRRLKPGLQTLAGGVLVFSQLLEALRRARSAGGVINVSRGF